VHWADHSILLTGATGFIGSHIARRLAGEKGVKVRALVRAPERARDLTGLGITIAQGDLADPGSLERALPGCTMVIHAAAQVSSVPDRAVFERANVEGTRNLLRAATKAAVSRFVHLSSIAVFGLAPAGEITDDSPRGRCGDPYCDTKFEAEEEVRRAQREGLPATILRPSAVYGPGSAHWSVIPLKRIKKGKMFLFDKGRGLLNYVYIANLVDAVLLAAEDDRALGEAFIVNDGAVPWRDYAFALARMAGKKTVPSIPLWAGKLWARYRNVVAAARGENFRVHPNALGFFVSSTVYLQTHIKRTLEHHSRVDLEEGLRHTEKWFHEAGLL